MTLFDYISEDDSVFSKVIDKYFVRNKDNRTISILRNFQSTIFLCEILIWGKVIVNNKVIMER